MIGALINFLDDRRRRVLLLVLPVNNLLKRTFAKQSDPAEAPVDVPPTDVELLSEIRDLLRARP